jgi:phosphoglycerol transferase MdoB-like AlkP superfamily enzyme
MQRYLIKKGIISILFFVFAILLEVITFSKMSLGVPFPQYFWFSFAIIFAISAILFVIPFSTVSVGLATVLLTAQSVVSFANVNLHALYGDIFSPDLLAQAGEAMEVLDFVDFSHVTIYAIMIAIFLAASIATLILIKDAKFSVKNKYSLATVFVIGITLIISPLAHQIQFNNLFIDTASDNILRANDQELYNNITFKPAFFSKFGTYPLYFKTFVLGQKTGFSETVTHYEFVHFFNTGNNFGHSEHWGADEGNNLIVIMMESLDTFFIHEKYTPSLYRLRNEGINFANFHTQAKTDVSEMSFILGSYPLDKSLNGFGVRDFDVETAANFFDFSVPNRLKANGFDTTSYFHSGWPSFYSRNETHPLYGFDNVMFAEYYDYDSINPDDFGYLGRWNYPEKWFFELAIDDIMPQNERFFSFITTMNPHGPYGTNISPHAQRLMDTIDDNDFGDLKDKTFYPQFKHALSGAMKVDEGVAYLIEQLQERDIFDKTTMVFYADHNAYFDGLAFEIKNSRVTQSPSHNVPAFIYSPNVRNLKIDKFTTTFDLVPTTFQLLGINLNSRFYLGYCAFGHEYQSVMFSKIGGVFNDKFYTSDAVLILWQCETATNEDFRRFQTDAQRHLYKMRFFNLLYERGCPPVNLD